MAITPRIAGREIDPKKVVPIAKITVETRGTGKVAGADADVTTIYLAQPASRVRVFGGGKAPLRNSFPPQSDLAAGILVGRHYTKMIADIDSRGTLRSMDNVLADLHESLDAVGNPKTRTYLDNWELGKRWNEATDRWKSLTSAEREKYRDRFLSAQMKMFLLVGHFGFLHMIQDQVLPKQGAKVYVGSAEQNLTNDEGSRVLVKDPKKEPHITINHRRAYHSARFVQRVTGFYISKSDLLQLPQIMAEINEILQQPQIRLRDCWKLGILSQKMDILICRYSLTLPKGYDCRCFELQNRIDALLKL